MNTIRRLCDRCIVLDEGKVVFDGDVEQGIIVYMNENNDSDYPVDYDFTDIKRQYHFGKQMFINSFSFIEKNSAYFSSNEKLKFIISISSSICVEKLKLFLVFRNLEQQVVGTSISTSFSINDKETKEIKGYFELSNFVVDDYYINIEIIEIDTEGNYYTYDNPGVTMKIKISESRSALKWEDRFWGNIQLADTIVLEGN